MSLPTHALRLDNGLTALAVGGVYRNPDAIDNCNRGRISCPGLDFSPATGRLRQPVGGKGSFPRDCSEIDVRLHSDCRFGRIFRGWGGVPGSARPPAACVLGNRAEAVG